MALYKIADFIIDIQNRFSYIEKQCAEYKYDGDCAADFTVSVTDAEGDVLIRHLNSFFFRFHLSKEIRSLSRRAVIFASPDAVLSVVLL